MSKGHEITRERWGKTMSITENDDGTATLNVDNYDLECPSEFKGTLAAPEELFDQVSRDGRVVLKDYRLRDYDGSTTTRSTHSVNLNPAETRRVKEIARLMLPRSKARQLLELPYTAYILDNDGTLVDTESIWIEVYRRLLAPYGISHEMSVHRQMMGLSPRGCIDILFAAHPALPREEVATEHLLSERSRLFRWVRSGMGLRPLPGVEAFLRHTKEKGVILAMATSASREDIEFQLDFLGWADYFQAVVTAENVTRHKPDPAVYLAVSGQLGIAPEHCLAFEDAASGLQSASNAGMKAIFVRDERFQVTSPIDVVMTVANLNDFDFGRP